MSIGARLKHAREGAGLTLAQAEERAKIGQSSLSEFENDKRQPRMGQLQALARVYRRSVAFFLGEGPLPVDVVLWRERPATPRAEEVEREFLGLCEQYHNLEVWCNEPTPCRLPEIEGDSERLDFPDAARLAKQVRDELQLGDRPGPLLLRVLEEVCGVKVFHMAFEPTGTAACTISASSGVAMLLNARNVRWRRNFDLAHELFHLLSWKVFRVGDGKAFAEPSEREEKLATCFARNLLMPEEPVRNALRNFQKDNCVPLDALFAVARQFDVSVEALLWQMAWLFNRKESVTRRDVERSRALATFYEEREHDDPPLRPARFFALALKALRLGEISQGRFAEYVGISRREARTYVEQEATQDEEVQITPA